MKYQEMKDQLSKTEREIHEWQKKELDKIINKMYHYPIARADEHHDFIREIEKELRDFKRNCLY